MPSRRTWRPALAGRAGFRRALAAATVAWLVASLAWTARPVEHGLRAQYFSNSEWVGPPVFARLDPDISTARLYAAWRAAPPESFSVQWSGYLDVPADGPRTFAIETDAAARVYVDDDLILGVSGDGSPATGAATIALTRGAHRVFVHYALRGHAYRVEWSWADEGAVLEPVPSWALTPRPPRGLARATRWIDPAWWMATAALALLLAAAGMQRAGVWSSPRRLALFAARVAAVGALGWLLYAGATEHARVVNDFKARGDQSGYLWDAQVVYANWHGRTPPLLVGERMRMPVYAGYLALAYTPRLSDDAFFVVAKTWNIRLALTLMAGLAVLFAWHLPPLVSFNLTLVVAFGYWSFKAGYSQPELLFYSLFFATFLSCAHLFRVHRPAVDIGLAALAGVLAGVTFLTKALVPPFVALFLAAYGGNEVARLWRGRHSTAGDERRAAVTRFAWRAAAGAAMVAAFLVVIGPYILNSQRVFGQYFYNTNTTYFMWYDDGGEARAIMLPQMDIEGRIAMSADEMPSPGRYLRTRSISQIAARLAGGFTDIIVRSYNTYWYFSFVLAYLGLAAAVIAARPRAFASLVRSNAAFTLFLVAYATVYLAGTAFFSVTSSTGTTRFFITHLTPLLFTLSYLISLTPFRDTTWRIGRLAVRPAHAHIAIAVSLAIGIAFFWWPRLMTTYGGF